MSVSLIKPSPKLKEQALAFKKEFIDHNEPVINGSELFDKIDSYEEWLAMIKANSNEKTVNPDWVVTDTFFAVNEDDRIVGMIDLRHALKGFLLDFGHSGYSVRPSERRKGYATEMLRQILSYARKIGMSNVILSTKRSNEPSIKTILKNGGVYERSFDFEGETADVYRIVF